MTSELFSFLAIFSLAILIFLTIVIYVFRFVIIRSRRAKAEIRAAFPDLIDAGFQFESPASLFAPVLSCFLSNGVKVSLHFRIPGRGYTGRLRCDGVQVWMIQLTGQLDGKERRFLEICDIAGGNIVFQSNDRIQWQPDGSNQKEQSHRFMALVRDAAAVLM
ncbi:MAG: hypothetical protein MI807_22955 [Verrucomicrobiales bacterium]|nr:hypothetical protein [Verrucomicrobiales bacterium]